MPAIAAIAIPIPAFLIFLGKIIFLFGFFILFSFSFVTWEIISVFLLFNFCKFSERNSFSSNVLDLLGLDDAELARLGLRLMKLELLYPLEPRRLAEFADGLDEVIVIDARRGFIEDQVRAALFNQIDHPFVLGQRDEEGRPWIARHPKVWAQTLALDLGLHLAEKLDCAELRTRTDRLRSRGESRSRLRTSGRSPVFCSGCPHSASTRLPEGAVAGGGI